MMSKDDWKAVYTKDDDLKLTKAGGNKIRRTMTPPIFSSGMLDILLIDIQEHLRSRHLRRSKNHGDRPLES